MFNFEPKENITEQEIELGKTTTIRDGITTQIMLTSTEGIFLISFALLLGANNFVIGILAAIPLFSQVAQLLGIIILEQFQNRRKVVVSMVAISRVFLIAIALIPVVSTGQLSLILLATFLVIRNLTGAIAGVSWNSWMRDLIPSTQLGVFFARRMRLASIVGTILLLIFSFFLDYWKVLLPDFEIYSYSILFLIGFLAGMIGVYFLYNTPEPRMINNQSFSISSIFETPLKDNDFRPLVIFLFLWNFAINLAAPFFTVYMLRQLELPLYQITLFLFLAQIFHIIFLRFWGEFADRFSNKSILGISTPIFILTFVLWTFTTLPGIYVLTYPLLIVIHILIGMTMSGITLATGNIALKLSPRQNSSSYLATVGILNAIAAGTATIIGGILVDYFADKTLRISLEWISTESVRRVPAVDIQQWDFVFLLAFVLGLFAIERLSVVKETGSIPRKEAISEVFNEVRSSARKFSTIVGISKLTQIPLIVTKRRKSLTNSRRIRKIETE